MSHHLKLLSPLGLHGRFAVTRQETEFMTQLHPGDEVCLLGPDDKPVAYAKAVDLWVGDLAVIPGSLLEMEQNPLHRTYSGLVMGLRMLLASDGIEANVQPDSKVACIVFDFSRSNLLEMG